MLDIDWTEVPTGVVIGLILLIIAGIASLLKWLVGYIYRSNQSEPEPPIQGPEQEIEVARKVQRDTEIRAALRQIPEILRKYIDQVQPHISRPKPDELDPKIVENLSEEIFPILHDLPMEYRAVLERFRTTLLDLQLHIEMYVDMHDQKIRSEDAKGRGKLISNLRTIKTEIDDKIGKYLDV